MYVNSQKISIVTVCKNAASTISETIRSVVTKKTNNIEYIIIDGASSDGTKDIVKRYSSSIDTFVSEEDCGISDAFNKGIFLANNELVYLLNGDDRLVPGALNIVMEFYKENPSVDVIHGDVLLYEGATFVKRVKPSKRWWYPWRLVLFNHPATFVRKNVYEKYGGYDKSYKIAMDVEIFLRWRKNGVNIAYLPKPLARMQAGGVSGRHAREGCRECFKALIDHGYPSKLAQLQYYGRLVLIFFISMRHNFIKRKKCGFDR